MGIKLNQFIKNLKEFNKAPMEKIKKEIIYIVYATLWQMAYHTIIDTGQARFLLLNKFCEKYNISYDELFNEYYNFWNNVELEGRIWGANESDAILSEKVNKNKYSMKLSIEDEGLYAQEYANSSGLFNGKHYPSKWVEDKNGNKRDNSNFYVRHLTMVSDMVNTGNFGSLDNFNYDAFVNEICKKIEKELLK